MHGLVDTQTATPEAKDETGIETKCITKNIASVDVFFVNGHIKSGKYVNSHLHLSIAYVLTANKEEAVTIKQNENSGVEWFPISKIERGLITDKDVYLYTKLIQQAKL